MTPTTMTNDTPFTAKRTTGQVLQDHNKDERGRFKTTWPCEACGKPAPNNYFSLSTSGDGVGVVLCGRARCPATTLSADDARDYILRRRPS